MFCYQTQTYVQTISKGIVQLLNSPHHFGSRQSCSNTFGRSLAPCKTCMTTNFRRCYEKLSASTNFKPGSFLACRLPAVSILQEQPRRLLAHLGLPARSRPGSLGVNRPSSVDPISARARPALADPPTSLFVQLSVFLADVPCLYSTTPRQHDTAIKISDANRAGLRRRRRFRAVLA